MPLGITPQEFNLTEEKQISKQINEYNWLLQPTIGKNSSGKPLMQAPSFPPLPPLAYPGERLGSEQV